MICAEGHVSPRDLLLLKEGLVRRDLLGDLQLPEMRSRELKTPANQSKQPFAVQTALGARCAGRAVGVR